MKLRLLLAAAGMAMCCAGAMAQKSSPSEAEKVGWQSIVCAGAPSVCRPLQARGFLFATPGASAVVMITHGSQGIDSRMYDYVDALRKEGFAALVIDHWGPRGVGVSHDDYVAAGLKGGNEFNMAADSLTAAEWLRARGYQRVGSIGESQGGGAAVMLQQRFAHTIIERNVRRLWNKSFDLKPVDTVVGMYAPCFTRNAKRDGYVGTPFLFILGEVDDETPARLCVRHVDWMNGRGAQARAIVLPGEGHSFDAPYRRQRGFGPNYAKCDILVDDSGVTELNSGAKLPGDDTAPMFARCLTRGGYHSGWWKDRFVAVPHWIAFFKQHL